MAIALKPVQKRTDLITRRRAVDLAGRLARFGKGCASRGAASRAGRGRCQAMNALRVAIIRLIAAAVEIVCLKPRSSTKATAVSRHPVIAPSTVARERYAT